MDPRVNQWIQVLRRFQRLHPDTDPPREKAGAGAQAPGAQAPGAQAPGAQVPGAQVRHARVQGDPPFAAPNGRCTGLRRRSCSGRPLDPAEGRDGGDRRRFW